MKALRKVKQSLLMRSTFVRPSTSSSPKQTIMTTDAMAASDKHYGTVDGMTASVLNANPPIDSADNSAADDDSIIDDDDECILDEKVNNNVHRTLARDALTQLSTLEAAIYGAVKQQLNQRGEHDMASSLTDPLSYFRCLLGTSTVESNKVCQLPRSTSYLIPVQDVQGVGTLYTPASPVTSTSLTPAGIMSSTYAPSCNSL
uniref:V-type ATP synthase alpha chain n=1 Tax=Lygus hesperus TaxID=30085 RepID=A0A0A9WEN3_LYGHE